MLIQHTQPQSGTNPDFHVPGQKMTLATGLLLYPLLHIHLLDNSHFIVHIFIHLIIHHCSAATSSDKESSHQQNQVFSSAEPSLLVGGTISSHWRNQLFLSAELDFHWSMLDQSLWMPFWAFICFSAVVMQSVDVLKCAQLVIYKFLRQYWFAECLN